MQPSIPWSSSVCFCYWKDDNHPFFEVYCAIFIGCTTAITRCHSLLFVITRCHSLYFSLSLFVTLCTTRYHSLSFVFTRCTTGVTRCYSLSLVVTRCTTRLFFVSVTNKFMMVFHDKFPIKFAFTYNISFVWWNVNFKQKKVKSSRKEYVMQTCFKFWPMKHIFRKL